MFLQYVSFEVVGPPRLEPGTKAFCLSSFIAEKSSRIGDWGGSVLDAIQLVLNSSRKIPWNFVRALLNASKALLEELNCRCQLSG